MELDLRAFDDLHLAEHVLLHHEDVHAVNTADDPFTVRPQRGPGGTLTEGRGSVTIPALSWNVLRFAKP